MRLVTFERAGPGGAEAARRSRSRRRADALGETVLGFESLASLRPGLPRLGALLPGGEHAGCVVDLGRALAVKLAGEDAGAPEAEAASLVPPDVLCFLRRLPESAAAAREALEFAAAALERYDAPDLLRAGVVATRESVRLLAPVPRPGKILGVARNYAAHGRERGQGALPEEPVLFLKAPSAVIGPEQEIVLPEVSRCVDYEGELAVVIGTPAHCVQRDAALAHVAGYCVANDVTARDFQNERGQHFVGKSCDTFAPLGPVLVTADEIPSPQDLALRTTLSGELVQSARTKEMLFSVAEIVAFASALMLLEPGDVILTGTPAGVGAAQTPPRWLRDGDVVEVEIERIGRLRSHVRGARQTGV